jgi:hypothetical protein
MTHKVPDISRFPEYIQRKVHWSLEQQAALTDANGPDLRLFSTVIYNNVLIDVYQNVSPEMCS